MGSFIDDEEEYHYYDAHENLASCSDSGSDCLDCEVSPVVDNCVAGCFQYDEWVRTPVSVRERRMKFFTSMGLGLERSEEGDSDEYDDLFRVDIGKIRENNLAVLRSEILDNEFSSRRSSVSCWTSDSSCAPKDIYSSTSFLCTNGKCGSRNQCNSDVEDRKLNLGFKSLDQLLKSEGSDSPSGAFCPIRHCVHMDAGGHKERPPIVKRVQRKWLGRLRSMTCAVNMQKEENTSQTSDPKPVEGVGVRRVKVRHCRKRLKELSALFPGQDIQAHKGLILSMKFSLDGHYLATAGEDKMVKIWKVVEDERSRDIDIPDLDPSCMYFTLNHGSGLAPLVSEKEKVNILNILTKSSDSACVIFPPKVFRLLETPVHLFQGHTGEVLDISWSKNNCLLSASVDKTVRLWQIGYDHCVKVFPHNNYVTSVQFNPENDDYFISGSIDGKVRIWGINDCQVVDWIDLRDIVTAVSYHPGGQAGVVGTITGVCRFFNVSGNHLQVEEKVYINSKKKSRSKRITGFQFFSEDPNKVVVTSADAQVQILSGVDVVTKCKGMRNGGNFMSASLTSNGNYIISASDDSNVYVWNCTGPEEPSIFESKSIKSFECFSSDASIAIPWCGMNTNNSVNKLHSVATDGLSYSLANDYYLDTDFRASATWPEEKLRGLNKQSVLCKSQYTLLKTSCKSLSNSHAWGLVIVTATRDGRIQSSHNYGLPVPV
ncbi:hypothetical protein Leryth_000199 [Lithospermum erythrorhizon]|nr:hypothetical protein Leryth_000199 [Lithospermum erythrorhizon]